MVHSGRDNNYLWPTLGCIRTTDEAMQTMYDLENSDSVTSITVIRENLLQTELLPSSDWLASIEPPGITI